MNAVTDELLAKPLADSIASTVDMERGREPHKIGHPSRRQIELEAHSEEQAVAGVKASEGCPQGLVEILVPDPRVGRLSILRRQSLHVHLIGEEIHESLSRGSLAVVPADRGIRSSVTPPMVIEP